MNLMIEDVRQALAGPRLGRVAHIRMATRPRPGAEEFSFDQAPRRGAVLLLLYPKQGQLHFILTRRTDSVLNHKGQVSFPGGAREKGDTSPADTAKREAEEELGISLDGLEILGALSGLYIAPSNYYIDPFVAYLPRRPDFHPCSDEVAELLEVPLDILLDPSLRREEVWMLRGRETHVPFFLIGGQKVWGATAMVLSEFAAMLEDTLPKR